MPPSHKIFFVQNHCPLPTTTSVTNRLKFSGFLEEYGKLLESVILLSGKLMIMGDFNILVNDPENTDAKKLANLAESFGLHQHVQSPIHGNNHVLDLILTSHQNATCNIVVQDNLLSDHFAILFKLDTSKPPLPKKELIYRMYKGIDADALNTDIQNSSALSTDLDNVDAVVKKFI